MRHTREEVIKRTIREFERLDRLVNNLTDEGWNRLLTRPEIKDPWTVKDALAHITQWIAPYSDALLGMVLRRQMNMPFDLLLGRKTFEIWAWQSHSDAYEA
jgi:hypothetical protein